MTFVFQNQPVALWQGNLGYGHLFVRSNLPRLTKAEGALQTTRSSMISTAQEKTSSAQQAFPLSLMINGCTGKMGRAVAEAAIRAGIQLVPMTFGTSTKYGQVVEIGGTKIQVHHPSEGEALLSSVFNEFPAVVLVDYTVPSVVNENVDLYCKVGMPFVMGTTGGDRERLYKTVQDSNIYAVISPQMGKQVVAFLAMMEILAEKFPGVFSGYSLEVRESHQAGKVDISGTVKAIIPYFHRMGVKFNINEVQSIRDPKTQVEMIGVPKEHLSGHAFHTYDLTSPDQTLGEKKSGFLRG